MPSDDFRLIASKRVKAYIHMYIVKRINTKRGKHICHQKSKLTCSTFHHKRKQSNANTLATLAKLTETKLHQH